MKRAYYICGALLWTAYSTANDITANLHDLSHALIQLSDAITIQSQPHDPLFEKYAYLFEKFPEGERLQIFNNLQNKFKENLDKELEDVDKNFPDLLWYHTIDPSITFSKKDIEAMYKIRRPYLGGYAGRGYTWFLYLCKGKRNDKSVKQAEELMDEQYKEDLVKNYKIHLMPKLEEINVTIITLMDELERNKQLQNSIWNFKVKSNTTQLKQKGTGEIMPLIVIYPASGKEAAQYVLDTVRRIYKGQKGLDITPRYNQKVTSLIYFAQGDGDYKGKGYEQYYEEPDRIYYKQDFTKDGKDGGYHLDYTEEA